MPAASTKATTTGGSDRVCDIEATKPTIATTAASTATPGCHIQARGPREFCITSRPPDIRHDHATTDGSDRGPGNPDKTNDPSDTLGSWSLRVANGLVAASRPEAVAAQHRLAARWPERDFGGLPAIAARGREHLA